MEVQVVCRARLNHLFEDLVARNAQVQRTRSHPLHPAEATRGNDRMRAVVHDRYGPPELLRVAEVERPLPKENEVLVRVHASTVTRGDAMGVRGVEYRFSRLFTGIRRPRQTFFGME